MLSHRFSIFCRVAVLALLAVAVFFRFWNLDCVPGLNGDETWIPTEVFLALHHRPFHFFSNTGIPINLPLSAIYAALSLHSLPSIFQLRLVTVLVSLLSLLTCFFLCRRVWGTPTAWFSTVACAVLPFDIAYSRFAWQLSLSLLAGTLVTYFSARLISSSRRLSMLGGLVASLLFALNNHLTAIFFAPIAALAFYQAYQRELRPYLHCASAIAISAIAAYLSWRRPARLFIVLHNLVDPVSMGKYLIGFSRLFSGVGVYQHITGAISFEPGSSVFLYDLAVFVVVGPALWGLVRRMKSGTGAIERVLGLGLLSGMGLIYLHSGVLSVAPNTERYSAWALAPAIWLFARGWAFWFESSALRAKWVSGLGLAVCSILLTSFYVDYFAVFARTGGMSHKPFRTTAQGDPKWLAFQKLEAGSRSTASPAHPTCILTSEWWSYAPLYYFAMNHEEFRVIEWDSFELLYEKPERLSCTRLVFVEFTQMGRLAKVRHSIADLKLRSSETSYQDVQGHTILVVTSIDSALSETEVRSLVAALTVGKEVSILN